VHDLGTRLGCYGVPNVPSPRLDAFAEEGVRFEHNYATAPYCSPSRGSIISGQYPHVNGLLGLCNLGWEWPPENHTLAKVLGAAGYETILFGLQHETRPEQLDRLGFQDVRAPEGSRRACDVVPLVEAFLGERGAASDKPFYARVGCFEVHRPFDAYTPEDPAAVSLPQRVADTPDAREDVAMYDGAIREMDTQVGRILDALDAAGLREDTLVVFTTDHGSPMPWAKATLYDAGIHTALLIRWPGRLPEGHVVPELISNVDLFTSLLDAAGVDAPPNIQGRSFLPLLTGGHYAPRDYIFAEKNTTAIDVKRCIRTERFKYIRNYHRGPELMLPTDIESSLTRRDMGNDHLRPRAEVELYDLAADPNETNNLASDPEYADLEAALAARLRRIQEATDDPILRGPIERPAIEAGIITGVRSRVAERSPFPRDGLVGGWEAAQSGRYDGTEDEDDAS
jgi:arylsulfatase A-like enzyme